ncbi:MAG: hypothetical protein HQL87_04895 [Magnetococcales bacterium]|nr:hypothetical protein [Magnetococcales bacterium]
MAVVLDGIIRQEDLDVLPQRVSFRDLVEGGRNQGDRFVRFLPDGRLPEQPGDRKDPEIPDEELHLRKLEAIERETYQKAFAAGEEAGLALGEQTMEREIAHLLPQFESALRQLDGLPRRIFASAERFLVETAILMTRELLAHELTVNPEGIVQRVRRLLDLAAGRRDIIIYLAPDHAALLQNLAEFEKLRIEADASVAPGSVRMVSDFGGIEDNLERQLAEMETGLREYLQDRLQSSGCEDVAEAARQSAERASARNRSLSPLVKGVPLPGREAAQPMGAPADNWPDASGQAADWVPESEEQAASEHLSAKVSYMDETIVSVGTGRHDGTPWEEDNGADFREQPDVLAEGELLPDHDEIS